MRTEEYPNPTHRQVMLPGCELLVDEAIADLIADLRARGVVTYGSCQEQSSGNAYIALAGAASLHTFLRRCVELARLAGDEPLARRVAGKNRVLAPLGGGRERPVGPDAWKVTVGVAWDRSGELPASEDLELRVQVSMPAEDAAVLSAKARSVRTTRAAQGHRVT